MLIVIGACEIILQIGLVRVLKENANTTTTASSSSLVVESNFLRLVRSTRKKC